MPTNIIRTILQKFLTVSIIYLIVLPRTRAAPGVTSSSVNQKNDFETVLERFLNAYYDEVLTKSQDLKSEEYEIAEDNNGKGKTNEEIEEIDVLDQMQGDQPVSENSVVKSTDYDVNNIRDRLRKDSWKEYLKRQIMDKLFTSNNFTNFTRPSRDHPSDFNFTETLPSTENLSTIDEHIVEKMRGFYPSCEVSSQEQEQFKDSEDIMNLYFDVDYDSNKNNNIASATLRLYRLPQNSTVQLDSKDDCNNSDTSEEEKLLRVSVYWYPKFQKKRRVTVSVKRRLSDSKVIQENSRWVELSVKPATKSWTRTGPKKLGLGILVEDQDGKPLRADKYFRGASCTVGVSTPIPIPTILRDAANSKSDKHDGPNGVFSGNSTSAVSSDLLLLPTIDICYLEFPIDTDISQFNSSRINACNLRKVYEENLLLAERDKMERLAMLHFPNARHIRHQRQHRQSKINVSDLAMKMEDLSKAKREGKQMSELERNMRNSMSHRQQIILTKEQLEAIMQGKRITR